jgi:hypothetical protein
MTEEEKKEAARLLSPKLLRLKEGPYLLTLLVAVLGWLLTHAVDRLESRPIVEYRITKMGMTGRGKVKCEIENLCVDRCFQNVRFLFRLDPKVKKEAYLTNITVTAVGPTRVKQPSPVALRNGLGQDVDFREFHPRWRVVIAADQHGEGKCRLLVESHGYGLLSGNVDALDLRKAGLSTFLMRHEQGILMLMIAVGALGVGKYMAWLSGEEEIVTPDAGGEAANDNQKGSKC